MPPGAGSSVRLMLDPDVARQLASRGRRAQEALARRDEEIRSAVEGGASLREVGAAVGLSHAAIAKIVRRPLPAADIPGVDIESDSVGLAATKRERVRCPGCGRRVRVGLARCPGCDWRLPAHEAL